MQRSVKTAILVSSITFGLGHIINLLNGAELAPTLLQLVYALAIGLMLSVFVVKTELCRAVSFTAYSTRWPRSATKAG